MWTVFFDLSSGGREKLGACTIWIEANEAEAVDLFERIFDRSPYNVTSSCCGADYAVFEDEPDINPGDFVVTASDTERLKSGHRLVVANASLSERSAAGAASARRES